MKLLIGLFLLLGFWDQTAFAVDLKEIEHELTTTGVTGWIHGSVEQQGLYVFTYRNPKDFFDYVEMSMVAATPSVERALHDLNRHDQIKVHGSFLNNPSPQKHIRVTAVDLLKPFVSPYKTEPHLYEAKVPDDLKTQSKAKFLVHAIGGDGHILVVEYKDVVCPVYVINASFTQGLSRNDVVEINYTIQQSPGQPTHLRLNETLAKPLAVVDSIAAKHGKPAVVEGALVLFPKSPEILFNVFAVQELLSDGLSRQYTLVNFESNEAFTKIRRALQSAWDRHPTDYVNGRNKLVSTHVRVRATGLFNEVDPNQANAQILLKDVDSIQLLEQ